MESKTSLSPFGDDRRSLNQSPSALRALTSSRLTRGRSRRDSCSTSSSSSTRSSIDSTSSPSCVTRTVSPDQCALHRFIVWAAVQRNTSQKMTPTDRLECPLLRCRKRFPNHEAMLRHLYTCDQLSTGEYWCYECGKAERFTDGKCKRCLGHPGKRRKIMSVAKNFFSTLGQKSRNQHLPDLDMNVGCHAAIVSPPSYDSLLVQPQEVELSSSCEILEIDSVELPLPPPSATFDNAMEHSSVVSMDAASAGLGATMSVMPDLSFDWPIQNDVDVNDNSMGRLDRPSLSLHTYGLGQRRKQQQPTTRTKNLSPSNSLRSNASTDTTASYLVSPTSAFSVAWTAADTNITSPTSDSMSPGGLLSRGCSNASRYSNYSVPPHNFISELPAEDVMLQPLPMTLPDDFNCGQQLLPLETAVTTSQSSDAGGTPLDHTPGTSAPVKATEMTMPVYVADANSFVGTAWDTLKTHISSSLEKLQHISQNPLVGQLQSLSPQQIADTGLATLRGMLGGRLPTTSIEALCFVHATYSLSLIIHEDETHNRSKQLFVQAFLYGNTLPAWERNDYLEVASAIWQPLDLSPHELSELILERHESSASRSSSIKGKSRASASTSSRPKQNILLEVAQFFLDELEYGALPSKVLESSEVLGSMLWQKHFTDTNDNTPLSGGFAARFKSLRSELCRGFPHADSLESKMKRIQKHIDNGSIRSIRRAELELMQAGKGCISLQEYFDSYVPEIRGQFEVLYGEHVPREISRMAYHMSGIDLMQTIISSICGKEAIKQAIQDPTKMAGEGALEEFIRNTTTGLEESWDDFLMMPDESLTMPTPLPDIQMEMGSAVVPDPIAVFYGDGGTAANETLQTPPAIPNANTEPPIEIPQSYQSGTGQKAEAQAYDRCEICGYRPKGDPQWFKGSMAKHKKLQHSTAPPKIYRCPYPGCTSQYKNRPDNLKQHQQDKGHFVGEESGRRPSKRKKREE